jgi:hypothetical protein
MGRALSAITIPATVPVTVSTFPENNACARNSFSRYCAQMSFDVVVKVDCFLRGSFSVPFDVAPPGPQPESVLAASIAQANAKPTDLEGARLTSPAGWECGCSVPANIPRALELMNCASEWVGDTAATCSAQALLTRDRITGSHVGALSRLAQLAC